MEEAGYIYLLPYLNSKKMVVFHLLHFENRGTYEIAFACQTTSKSLFYPCFQLLEAVLNSGFPMVLSRDCCPIYPSQNQGHLWMQIGLLFVFAVISVQLVAQFYSAKAAVPASPRS